MQAALRLHPRITVTFSIDTPIDPFPLGFHAQPALRLRLRGVATYVIGL